MQPGNTLCDAYLSGRKGCDRFRSFVERIAEESGAVPGFRPADGNRTPVKKIFRAIEKVLVAKHEPGAEPTAAVTPPWTSVYDLYSAMITCDGPAMDLCVLTLIDEAEEIEVVRWKDRLNSPTDAGWADSLINVRMEPGGHIYEVQVVQNLMMTARHGLHAHQAYADARGRFEALRAVGKRC